MLNMLLSLTDEHDTRHVSWSLPCREYSSLMLSMISTLNMLSPATT